MYTTRAWAIAWASILTIVATIWATPPKHIHTGPGPTPPAFLPPAPYKPHREQPMGSVYRYGPSQAGRIIRGQIPVALGSVDESPTGELVTLDVGPHDPSIVAPIIRAYAVYAPAPPAADEAPEAYLNGSDRHVGTLEVGPMPTGGAIKIPVDGVPSGTWFVQTVLQMSDAPIAPAPTP